MISLIVAYDKNKLIGGGGKMPWDIKSELRRFRELTTGNVVIMGRKTYESIGSKPLPDRINIIVSSSLRLNDENCFSVGSIEEAIEAAKKTGKEIYISGGSTIYEKVMYIVDVMYITEIDAEFEGDVYFPEFDESLFTKEIVEHIDEDIPYTYVTYTRK